MEMYKKISSRQCSVCLKKVCNNWYFIGDRVELFHKYRESRYATDTNLKLSDWVCDDCNKAVQKQRPATSSQEKTQQNENPIDKLIENSIQAGFCEINTRGYVERQSFIDRFKTDLSRHFYTGVTHKEIMTKFNNVLTGTINKQDNLERVSHDNIGTLLYNKEIVTDKILPDLLRLIESEKTLQRK